MYILNRIDEKQRFCGFKAYVGKGKQADSHTYSYLQCREMFQDMGDVMGLEKTVTKEEKPTNLKKLEDKTRKIINLYQNNNYLRNLRRKK